MRYLIENNLMGLLIGVATFLIIGFFHPIVVKAEYYFGKKIWFAFFVLGVIGIVGSIMVKNLPMSVLIGVFAFSSFWSIKEVVEQEKRVRKGWFPKNPKRKYDF